MDYVNSFLGEGGNNNNTERGGGRPGPGPGPGLPHPQSDLDLDPRTIMAFEGHPPPYRNPNINFMAMAQGSLMSSTANMGKVDQQQNMNSTYTMQDTFLRDKHYYNVDHQNLTSEAMVNDFLQGNDTLGGAYQMDRSLQALYQNEMEINFGEWDRIFQGQHSNTFIEDWEIGQMEQVYGTISNREGWVEDFQNTEEWKELAMKANMIDDAGLQASEFMGFIRGLQALSGQKEGVWADQFEDEVEQAQHMDWEQIWREQQSRKIDDLNYELKENDLASGDLELAKSLFDSGRLRESILELENYLVSNPKDDQAWKLLGRVQAENDNDTLAIQALNNAIELNPSDLDTLILLGVSHTNNFNTREVYEVFLQWIHQNPTYSKLAERYPVTLSKSERENHKMVSDLFIRAAKLSPGEPDPDVHIALGVLYNLNFEYDKAEFCFREALKKRPDDYQLWNKLGATLANSQKNEEAADSYIRALEKKPEYTRSRSNLGLAYMALRDYRTAAECFLGAISINNTEHLWKSLSTSFTLMRRPDLVEASRKRDIEMFRNEFHF